MSVTVTGVVTYDDGRVYAGLPPGVRPFWGRVRVTCDASGGYAFGYLQFNTNSQDTFQPYVQISNWTGHNEAAGVTEGITLGIEQNDWERSSALGASVLMGVVQPISLGAVNEGIGVDSDIKLIGRVVKGLPGRMYVAATNTNNKIVTAFVTGLTSDFPIVGLDTVRV